MNVVASRRARWRFGRRHRQFLSLAGPAALSVMLVACQSADTADVSAGVADLPADSVESPAESSAGSDGDGEPTEAEIEEAQLAFEQCLSDAGIDVGGAGDGEPIGEGNVSGGQTLELEVGDEAGFEEVLEECNEAFEGVAGSFQPSPEQEAEFRDAEAAFVNCMADNGIEIDVQDGGAFTVEATEADDLDEQQLAMDSCSKEAFGDGLGLEDEEG